MYYDLDLVIRKQIRSTNQKSKCQHVVMPAVPPTWRGPRRRRLGRCLCCSGCQCRTAAATRNDAERRHAVFEVSAYRRECHCRARDSNYLIDRCYGGHCLWPFLATAGCAASAAGENSRLRVSMYAVVRLLPRTAPALILVGPGVTPSGDASLSRLRTGRGPGEP